MYCILPFEPKFYKQFKIEVEYFGHPLLDEIEKSHPNVMKIFLQMMGDGIITDAIGNQIDCKNLIIIMTGNFGLNEKKEIVRIGTNAKVHEITACIGLTNLEIVDKSIAYRKDLYFKYIDALKDLIQDDKIQLQKFKEDAYNYSYFPVIFKSEEKVLQINELLKDELIMARRYFYPSLNKLKWGYRQSCPISEDISKRILCLPSHDRVTDEDIQIICSIIKSIV
jgi:dTDP-4-amino-4,6-dideoxygalactose transaminase